MAIAELRVTQKLNDYEFGVTIRVMRSGVNKNLWDYQNLEQHYLSILGQPILCAFPNGRIGDGHLMEAKRGANGEEYYSFISKPGLEQIVGTISDDPKDVRLVQEDGETWLVAEGRLFSFYAHELVEYIRRNKVMDVSVETEVFESHTSEVDPKIEVFTSYKLLGVTILGSGVAPAIPGANIKALQAMEEEFKELKLKAASYRMAAEEEHIDVNDVGEEEGQGETDDVDDINEPDDPNDTEEDDGSDDTDKDSDGGAETQKPQKENLSKGANIMQVLSKRQVAELAPKFEGYTVMAGGHDDAGYHFCLMSEDGATAIYSMNSLEDIVDPNKIARVAVKASFKIADNESIDVELDDITDSLSSNILKANGTNAKLSAELDAANETIETMKTAEMKRRVSAAKATAVATLDKFNAHHEDKVADTILVSINEQIDNGDYTDCLNGEGEWCGEEEVAKDVLAKCAEQVIEHDKARVARNSRHYAWDSKDAERKGVNDISALLARIESRRN